MTANPRQLELEVRPQPAANSAPDLFTTGWTGLTPHLGVSPARVCECWTETTSEGGVSELAYLGLVFEVDGQRWEIRGVTLAEVQISAECHGPAIGLRAAVAVDAHAKPAKDDRHD